METVHLKVVNGMPRLLMLKAAQESALMKELDGYHLTKVDIATVKISKTVSVDVKKARNQPTTSTINPSKEN